MRIPSVRPLYFGWLVAALLTAARPLAHAAGHEFDLGAIAASSPVLVRDAGGSFRLRPVSSEQRSVALPGTAAGVPWDSAKFLVAEVEHDNAASLRVIFEFRRDRAAQPEPDSTAGITIFPRLPVRMVLPLDALLGEARRLPPNGRQLMTYFHGRLLDRTRIAEVRVRLQPLQFPDFVPTLRIRSLRLTDTAPGPEGPPPQPLIDPLGQWNLKDWSGKTRDEVELRGALHTLRTRAARGRAPEAWSRFGGWKSKRFAATGWFRTHHDGQRWWLVDPEGHAFLSVGPNIVSTNTVSRVAGIENLYAWLPEPGSEAAKFREGGTINFLSVNLYRAFGTEWRMAWEEMAFGLMREWGFNTIANRSNPALTLRGELPYTYRLAMNPGDYPTTARTIYRDFPDVFAPEFEARARTYALTIRPVRDDPWMIGYFMMNEPEWSFGRHNLGVYLLQKPGPFHSRTELGRWLARKYRDDLAAFNRAWNVSWQSFDEAKTWLLPRDRAVPDVIERELWEFARVMVERYFAIPAAELRKQAPYHLNLGVRFPQIASDLAYAGAQAFDVFSLNSYAYPGPSSTAEIAQATGKPVLIGEFHFGALDAGLPSVGLRGVATQRDRGHAYANYLALAVARPEVVGAHYFQWNDQTVPGRADGEHYNIGVMDVCHRPYEEFVRSLRPIHERMYEIAAGTHRHEPLPVTVVPSINTNQ